MGKTKKRILRQEGRVPRTEAQGLGICISVIIKYILLKTVGLLLDFDSISHTQLLVHGPFVSLVCVQSFLLIHGGSKSHYTQLS